MSCEWKVQTVAAVKLIAIHGTNTATGPYSGLEPVFQRSKQDGKRS